MCQSEYDFSLQISWLNYRPRPFEDVFNYHVKGKELEQVLELLFYHH